jgi:hypothetical protein
MRSMVEGAFGIEVNRHGRRPFHRSFAGQEKQIRSRGAFRARGLLGSLPPKEGSGAPKGATIHCPRYTDKCCHSPMRRARKRALSGRARLPALHCGTRHARRIQHWLSSRPALPETRLAGRYPFSPVSSLPSTSETGRNAGRSGTQSRPSAGLRIPPAGTALAPSIGRHR